jgi:LPXTG-site transpeptidase (sortase) family protein
VAPVTGAALIWSSLGFVGYAAGWTVREHRADARLVAQVRTPPAVAAVPGGIRIPPGPAATTGGATATADTTRPGVPCVQAAPQLGQLAGVLDIPSLGLDAPVEEGTDDAELAVAAGHAPASVWPGQAGSAVLLAHDVSYFVHLGSLRPGDLITYRDQCTSVDFRVTGQQVVAAGSPVYDSTTPTLVLDTCWPTNALFYTSQRLLVTADEVPAATVATATRSAPATGTGPFERFARLDPVLRAATPTAPAPPSNLPAVDPVAYTTPAPPGLVAEGLTLEQNEVPMGTLTLTGDPSTAFEESPGPLSLTAAALEAYFGGIHAAGQDRADWWSAIAPGVTMPAPLTGATITGHDGALDVSIGSTGGAPSTVTLTTGVTVSGGAAPGSYQQTVGLAVAGTTVTIDGWGMTDG